ncbi:aminopeptidase [Candidatus Woesearchaeota archaeon]|nr:aminopeptidase [Candidatus Woesearchaeota archaeon]
MNPSQTILQCLNVKKDENVLIIADKNTENIAHEILHEAIKLTHASLRIIPVGKQNGDEPPKNIADEMKKYDVIIAPTTMSLTHTKAVQSARHNARIATLPGITEEIMKGSLLADYNKINSFNRKLSLKIKNCKDIKVKTKAGSDFSFKIRKNDWRSDGGILHEKGLVGNLPAGEIFTAPIEKTFNGIIVIDSFLDKETEYAKKGARIEVKNGNALSCSDKNSELNNYFVKIKNARNIAEFGIGTNYKAKLIGNILNDEKIKGTVHVAFGNNTSMGGKIYSELHLDTILQKPDVYADGKLLMKNGKFSF